METTKALFKYVDNSSYNYIPHIVFFGFILIGILFGLWLGYRSSVYFGVGVIGALIITTLLITFIPISFLTRHAIPFELKVGSLNINTILEKNEEYLRPITLLLFFISSLLIILLIQFIFYPFFRKKYFKKNIKINKKNNQSNLSIRTWGALTSAFFMIPLATIFASYGAVMSNGGISSIYSKATTIFTFGQVTNTTENIKDLAFTAKSVIYLVDRPDAIASLLGSDKPDPTSIKEIFDSEEGREAIAEIFNSKLISQNIDVITDQLSDDQFENINLNDKTDISWAENINLKKGPIQINQIKFDNFIKEAVDKLTDKGAKVSEAGLRHLLINGNLIKTN